MAHFVFAENAIYYLARASPIRKYHTTYLVVFSLANGIDAKLIQSAIETTAQAVGAARLFRWRMGIKNYMRRFLRENRPI